MQKVDRKDQSGKNNPSYSHGYATRKDRPREYHVWGAMKQRCYYIGYHHYKDYGGRGITVCQRWLDSFQNFIDDMGMAPSPKHSLDRIDTNGNYEPSNCKWSTVEEQRNNMRRNLVIDYIGKRQTLSQWCTELGINYSMVLYRLQEGKWSVHDAFTKPSKKIKG